MYNIPYFKEKDSQVVINFLRQHPFAMLIGSANNLPVATQIPMLIDEQEGKLFLTGHFMRNTDHHKAFVQNNNALCVFTGAHTYVSASWYTQPETASTWNYMSVHARGVLQFTNEERLLDILKRTTALFENNEASLASFHHLSKDYVDRLSKAIVGFQMEVQQLENVFKLSQNRDEKSYHNIMQQLQQQDADAQTIAAEMQNRTEQLFQAQPAPGKIKM
jgi:transcriptional regulator